jgi:hypothetical protein
MMRDETELRADGCSAIGRRGAPDCRAQRSVVIHEKDVHVAMRDGVKIGLRIYRPDGTGTFPALFAASPYRYDNNETPATPLFLWRETGPIEWYVEQGDAYVHADVRGAGYSEGEFGFFSRAEQQDLYELIEWIAKQPWSNGKVGGIGQSYYCISQWFMGAEPAPPRPHRSVRRLERSVGYCVTHGGSSNFLYWFNSSVRVPNLPGQRRSPALPGEGFLPQCQRHPSRRFWKAHCRCNSTRSSSSFLGGRVGQDGTAPARQSLGFRRRAARKAGITGTLTPFSSMSDFTVEFHKAFPPSTSVI